MEVYRLLSLSLLGFLSASSVHYLLSIIDSQPLKLLMYGTVLTFGVIGVTLDDSFSQYLKIENGGVIALFASVVTCIFLGGSYRAFIQNETIEGYSLALTIAIFWIILLAFLGGVGCCTYTYIAAAKIKEYGGKPTMFNQLEKDRFIQEQLILQESYLYQLRQQQLGLNIGYQNQTLPIDVTPLTDNQSVKGSMTDNSETVDNNDVEPSVSHQSVNQSVISQSVTCPNCESSNISKNGTRNGKQKLICNDCNGNFSIPIKEG